MATGTRCRARPPHRGRRGGPRIPGSGVGGHPARALLRPLLLAGVGGCPCLGEPACALRWPPTEGAGEGRRPGGGSRGASPSPPSSPAAAAPLLFHRRPPLLLFLAGHGGRASSFLAGAPSAATQRRSAPRHPTPLRRILLRSPTSLRSTDSPCSARAPPPAAPLLRSRAAGWADGGGGEQVAPARSARAGRGPARLLPPRAGSGRAELRAARRSGGGARGPAPLSSLDLGRRAPP